MPLGEHQVHHPQHRGQAARQVGGRRQAERDPGLADLPLGPDQPLRHGRLGDQECGGDLGRGQPAHRAQRQPHPGRRVERGVAAGEDQRKLVVGARRPPASRVRRGLPTHRLGLLARPAPLPPHPVERLVPRRPDQPPARAVRHAVGGPLGQGRGAGLLHRVLGHLEVAHLARHGGDRRPPVGAEHLAERAVIRLTAQRGPPLGLRGALPPCPPVPPGGSPPTSAPRPGRRTPPGCTRRSAP